MIERLTREQWDDLQGKRWPRVRTGEREPIPWQKRRAVIIRDGGTCAQCGYDTPTERIELDHIVPWSAAGSDDSENLRVRCQACNQSRSNWFDGTEDRKVLPVTYWCDGCAEVVDDGSRKLFIEGGRDPEDGGHDCWTCGQLWWCIALAEPDPRLDGMLVVRTLDAPRLAYCAHCRCTGYTRWAL